MKELCIMSLVSGGNDGQEIHFEWQEIVCSCVMILQKYKLGTIVKHVSQHGLTPRQHVNAERKHVSTL
jgi:hypothetical protein